MDIRKFAVEPTSRLHLRDAADNLMYTDDGHEIAVNLYGPGSKQYAKAQSMQNNKLFDKLKRKGKSDQTEEQKLQETAEFLAMCTASFENLDYDGLQGNALAIAVYSDISIGFIADQVAKHISDWSNFTKRSVQN